jgi:hypothetical protein
MVHVLALQALPDTLSRLGYGFACLCDEVVVVLVVDLSDKRKQVRQGPFLGDYSIRKVSFLSS